MSIIGYDTSSQTSSYVRELFEIFEVIESTHFGKFSNAYRQYAVRSFDYHTGRTDRAATLFSITLGSVVQSVQRRQNNVRQRLE